MTDQLPTPEQLEANPSLDPNIPIMDDGGLDQETAKNLGLYRTPEEIEALAQSQQQLHEQMLQEAWNTNVHDLSFHLGSVVTQTDSCLTSFETVAKLLPKIVQRYMTLEIPIFLDEYRRQGMQHLLDQAHIKLIEAHDAANSLQRRLAQDIVYLAENEILVKYPEGYVPPETPEAP